MPSVPSRTSWRERSQPLLRGAHWKDSRQAAANEIITKLLSPTARAQRYRAISTLFDFQNLAGQGPEQPDQTLTLPFFEKLVKLESSWVIPKLFSGPNPLPTPQCLWGQASQKWAVSCCALWLAAKLLLYRNRSSSRRKKSKLSKRDKKDENSRPEHQTHT